MGLLVPLVGLVVFVRWLPYANRIRRTRDEQNRSRQGLRPVAPMPACPPECICRLIDSERPTRAA
jgi:hypothetical protein